MLDTRAYDGWRRLTASVIEQAKHDDPAALAQLVRELDKAQAALRDVATALREPTTGPDGVLRPGYSWAEIGAELGVPRQAAAKRFGHRG